MQSSRIEISQHLGKLRVGMARAAASRPSNRRNDDRRDFHAGRFCSKKSSAHVEIASLARQPSQGVQPLERTLHATACRLLRSHGQGHA